MKRILSLILIAVFVLSLSATAFAYTDTAGHGEEQAINQWGSLLVPETNGAFEPSKAVTRAEFAHVVNSIVKYPTATPTFQDTVGHKYASDIGALQKAGVVEGTVKGVTFEPDTLLTRQEAAKMLGIAFGLPKTAEKTSFADDEKIADWAKPYVESLKTFSYISGRGANDFDPKANLTRSEISKIAFNVTPGTQAAKANYVVTSAGTIKDKEFNNLIIASSVTGEVTLENVKVNGSLVVLGANGDATTSYANTGKAQAVNLAAVSGNAIVENFAATGVTLNITGTSVIGQVFVKAIATLNINAVVGLVVVQQAAVNVTIGAAGVVTTVIATTVATALVLTNNGTIETLTVVTQDATIVNNGTILVATHTEIVTITGEAPVDDEIVPVVEESIYE